MTPYVITLHRERILSQSKKAFSSNGDKKTRIRGKPAFHFFRQRSSRVLTDRARRPCGLVAVK